MVHLTEVRIPLPFTVEEFRRGMKYSNWKTNEQHTEEGQGGQLLSSTPYFDEKWGEGLFSHSVYRLGDRLPDWVTRLVPANALVIDEKTWACYPYLRTVMTCPFFTKLRIEVITLHMDDDGSCENAVNLPEDELAIRKVDFMDIARDKVGKRDYRADQDPSLVASKVTGRGPLKEGWQSEAKPKMCAYKVIKAQCNYWGFQTRAEKFIIKGVRDIFLLTHRNAFCWLDQWFPLSFQEIVDMEASGRQKLKSTVKQPPVLDPNTGKLVRFEDEPSPKADEDAFQKGSDRGSESDDEDMENEFFEALMEWGTPEEAPPRENVLSPTPLTLARSREGADTAQQDGMQIAEADRCGLCEHAKREIMRATLYCNTCTEQFCSACFAQWHVTPRLRGHRRSALVTPGGPTTENEGPQDSATPWGGAMTNGGRRLSASEEVAIRDRESIAAEIEQLRLGGASSATDLRVAETMLDLFDFERPLQPPPWLQAKTKEPLNKPVEDSPGSLQRSASLASLGSLSPTLLGLKISAEMVTCMIGVYRLCEARHVRDPYETKGTLELGSSQRLQKVTSFGSDPAALMKSKLFLKFRLLGEQLAEIDPRQLAHDDRLAFWINIYNALLMHAHLVNGIPKKHYKRVQLFSKATYTIGGFIFSALEIEHSILRAASYRPTLAGLLPVHKFRANDPRLGAVLERPEPLISFALCCGCKSAPAVRVYFGEGVREELLAAARDYCSASIGFTKGKVQVPKIIQWYAKDFSQDTASLLEWVSSMVTEPQRQAIKERTARSGKYTKCMTVLPYDWSFCYLLPSEAS